MNSMGTTPSKSSGSSPEAGKGEGSRNMQIIKQIITVCHSGVMKGKHSLINNIKNKNKDSYLGQSCNPLQNNI